MPRFVWIVVIKRADLNPSDSACKRAREKGSELWIGRVFLGDIAIVIHITKSHLRFLLRSIAGENRASLAVRGCDGYLRTRHTGKENRRTISDLDQAKPGLELFRLVSQEFWPTVCSGDEFVQKRHHLATVTNAE